MGAIVPKVLLSVDPNAPPDATCVPPYLMVYDPLPYEQQIPSPYESLMVNVYSAGATQTVLEYKVFVEE